MSYLIRYIFILLVPFLFSGCFGLFFGSDTREYSQFEVEEGRVDRDNEIRDSEAIHRATMRPYQVFGKWYYPTMVNVGDRFEGIASWYGPKFHGKKTSNGEIYSMYKRTAAHKTLPMNTMVRVQNLENGKVTVVRINDRGPFVADRIIDLSNTSAREIDMVQKGTARVKIEILGFKGTISTLVDKSGDKIEKKERTTQDMGEGGVGALDGRVDIGEQDIPLSPPPVVSPIEIPTDSFESDKNIERSRDDDGNVNSYMIEGFYVQIGAFRLEDGAKRFAAKQNIDRYDVKIKKYDSEDGEINRVLVGEFKSENEAKDFIEKSKYMGAFIFRESN